MKTKNIIKWLALPAVLGLLSLATAQADTTLGNPTYAAQYTAPSSPYLLGTVIPRLAAAGGQGQLTRDAAMTNTLIGMATGTQAGTNPGTQTNPLYSRSFNAFSPLPTATDVNGNPGPSSFGSGTTVSINLDAIGTFTYLVVTYDGPNSGTAVWDIAGLTGTITFAAFGQPEFLGALETGNLIDGGSVGQYQITHWSLLNPTSAPDGGATVMLLGMALGALGMVRRYLAS